MSMTCLQDYIGLRGCGAAVPPSGLYVNDLPGISLKQLVNLTNEEETTYVQLWDVIQKRAMNRFSLDVREAMGKYYKLNSLMQGVNLGKQLDGPLSRPSQEFIGFTIELIDNATYEYAPSPLASIHIQEILFYASENINGAIFKIYDISTGTELMTKTVNLITGWNTIPINTTFHNNYSVNSWRIGCFYFDTQDLPDIYSLQLPTNHQIPGCCDIRVRGALASVIPIDDSIEFTSNSYGLTGTFSIVCSWDAVICQNKTLFSRAFWYLCGIELLTEQLYSTKLNLFTTTNLQRAKELREEYQVEYAKSLEQVAGGFKLNCDCCIDCAGQVQLRETNQFY